MLLLQLALIEHADKQCCIMLLSCKQSDSRSFLGCISCMIAARLCCFTGSVCKNIIKFVIEVHDIQCCCRVLGGFERQVAKSNTHPHTCMGCTNACINDRTATNDRCKITF